MSDEFMRAASVAAGPTARSPRAPAAMILRCERGIVKGRPPVADSSTLCVEAARRNAAS